MPHDTNTLGEAIRRARRARGMTQVALGAVLGVSRQTVSGWEAGRYRPQRRLLELLTATLGGLSRHMPGFGVLAPILAGLETTDYATRKLTWIELAREELGAAHSDADLDAILWNETGFPCYWPDRDKSPEENCRQQLREFAAKYPPAK